MNLPMKPSDGWFLGGFIVGLIGVHLTVENVQVPWLSESQSATHVAGTLFGVGLGLLLFKLHANGVLPGERPDPWESG